MPTSFPSSADSFPAAATLAADQLSTDPHSTLHGNLGDALRAVEVWLLAALAPGAFKLTLTANASLGGANTGDQDLSGYVPTTRTVNGHALSANVTVSASDVGLGSVTNDAQTKAAVVPNTAPSAGQILAGNAGGTAYAPVTLSGSGATFTLSSAGVLAVSAVANASLANSSVTVTAGTGLSGGGAVALGGTITLTNAGATAVSNSDGTLTISPTSGAVVASLALGHANTWTTTQTFQAPVSSSSAVLVAKSAASATGNLLECYDTAGNLRPFVNAAGAIVADRLSSTGYLIRNTANTGSAGALRNSSDQLLIGSGSWTGADIQNGAVIISGAGATGLVGVGLGAGATPAATMEVRANDAATATVTTASVLGHHSSGTPAAGFGSALLWQLDSSTTANQPAAEEQAVWATATHASRKGRWAAGAHDASTSAGSPREGVRVESDGGQALLGFYGASAIARAVLATGAGHTVDDVITALQNLGLVKQS